MAKLVVTPVSPEIPVGQAELRAARRLLGNPALLQKVTSPQAVVSVRQETEPRGKVAHSLQVKLVVVKVPI